MSTPMYHEGSTKNRTRKSLYESRPVQENPDCYLMDHGEGNMRGLSITQYLIEDRRYRDWVNLVKTTRCTSLNVVYHSLLCQYTNGSVPPGPDHGYGDYSAQKILCGAGTGGLIIQFTGLATVVWGSKCGSMGGCCIVFVGVDQYHTNLGGLPRHDG